MVGHNRMVSAKKWSWKEHPRYQGCEGVCNEKGIDIQKISHL